MGTRRSLEASLTVAYRGLTGAGHQTALSAVQAFLRSRPGLSVGSPLEMVELAEVMVRANLPTPELAAAPFELVVSLVSRTESEVLDQLRGWRSSLPEFDHWITGTGVRFDWAGGLATHEVVQLLCVDRGRDSDDGLALRRGLDVDFVAGDKARVVHRVRDVDILFNRRPSVDGGNERLLAVDRGTLDEERIVLRREGLGEWLDSWWPPVNEVDDASHLKRLP